VGAEFLAYHDGFWDCYVFGCVVHFYYHVYAYCSVPVAYPYEAFFFGFLYEEVECVGFAAEAFECRGWGYGVAFLFEVVCCELL